MGQTRFNNYTQFSATAVSGTNTYHSAPTDINQMHNLGLDITFIGTMAGTLTVEACNDNINFKALTFNPVLSQPAGSGLAYLIDLNQVPWQYIRTSYVNSSGSGTLTSILTSKDLS